MRYTQLLLSTRKERGNHFGIASQDLLVQAGYVRQVSAGIFSALHFGLRSFQKIEQILREEMNAIGGVEISMPVVHPAELWKRTGRYDEVDESLVRFTDRAGRDNVLGMTHEEIVAFLAQSEISTYKQLPKLIYQLQTKFRDEPRSRGGLIRVREFVMKDSYSLDTSWGGLEKQYQAHYEAYFKMFRRTGLPVIAIESDVGMMGGKIAHEYMYLTEIGEDTIFICESTGYQANKEVATFQKSQASIEEPRPLEKVHTPGTKTIAEVADFLGVPHDQCGKAVFYGGEIDGVEKVILAIVRGDMEVNNIKLQNLTKTRYLLPATEEQIRSIGSVPGFAAPIDIDRSKAVVVVDDLIPQSANLVLGANEEDHHLKNVCYGRDFEADFEGDIVNAYDGAPAPNAQSHEDVLRAVRGIEVGNIFQLGTKYTEGLEAFYMDQNGRTQPIVMGSYGIGVGRLLGCLAEAYHDDKGLMLPVSVAPYEVIIVGLLDNEEVTEAAEALYSKLKLQGVEVLYDDRPKKMASPGEKFSDADLIGIPVRITVSRRSLKNGGAEVKLRSASESKIVRLEEVLTTVEEQLELLKRQNED